MAEEKQELAVLYGKILSNDEISREIDLIQLKKQVAVTLSNLAQIVLEHGGKVFRTDADHLLCAFSNPKKAVQAAYDMQLEIHNDLSLAQSEIGMKAGMHYGTVLMDEHEAYGDVTSVAYELMNQSEKDMVMATKALTIHIPANFKIHLAGIGKIRIKGLKDEVDVYEVLWKENEPEDQTIFGGNASFDSDQEICLVIRHKNRQFIIDSKRNSFLLGRSDQNDLIVADEKVSRNHAAVQYRNGKYFLVDRSTNGTYIKTESKELFSLRKDELLLRGRGVISLGQAVSKSNADLIYYAGVPRSKIDQLEKE